MFDEIRDRVTFAAEGVALAAADLLDALRDRRELTLAGLAALAAVVTLLIVAPWSDDGESAPAAEPAQIEISAASHFVRGRGFSIALPEGWRRTEPPAGASFAAASKDGLGETTLWIDRKPDLGFGAFVRQSMSGLERIGTEVTISDRVEGPTLETSIAELRAQVPRAGGAPAPYRVTLRAAGPFRYYLATSLGLGATPRLVAEAELLTTSFRPDPGGGKGDRESSR